MNNLKCSHSFGIILIHNTLQSGSNNNNNNKNSSSNSSSKHTPLQTFLRKSKANHEQTCVLLSKPVLYILAWFYYFLFGSINIAQGCDCFHFSKHRKRKFWLDWFIKKWYTFMMEFYIRWSKVKAVMNISEWFQQ